MELKVIDCESVIPKPKPDYYEIYERSFMRTVEKSTSTGEFGLYVKPLVLWGIKMFNADSALEHINKFEYEDVRVAYEMMNAMIRNISKLTPNEMINLFPIEKTYKRGKCDLKWMNYFSTMKSLENMGLDTPIGDNIRDFLRNYQNDEVREFFAKFSLLAGRIHKAETGREMTEEFLKQNNVPYYRLVKDTKTKKEFFIDSDGNVTKVKRNTPRYLKPL